MHEQDVSKAAFGALHSEDVEYLVCTKLAFDSTD